MRESFGEAPTYKTEKGYSTSEIIELSNQILEDKHLQPEYTLDDDPDSITSRYSWVHPKRDERVTFTVTCAPENTRYYSLHIRPIGHQAALTEMYAYTAYADGSFEVDELDEEDDPVDRQDETSKIIAGLRIVEQLREFHASDRPDFSERRRIIEQREELDSQFETIAAHELLEQDIYHERVVQLMDIPRQEDRELAIEILISGLQNNHSTFNHTSGALTLRAAIYQELYKK